MEAVDFGHAPGALLLDQVSLDFEPGTVTAVVGVSGVGKSTLLSLLNGLLRPRRGRVMHGRWGDLAHPAALLEHRRCTATIFQDHALLGRLTALDNVLLGLADQRSPWSPRAWSDVHRASAAKALDDVGLLSLAMRPVRALSGGERQRVGIARALVRRPRLLLGDEPFAAVDPALSAQLGAQIRHLAVARGLTVVLVLHQIELARQMADRIVGLRAGGLVFDGAARDFDATAAHGVYAR